MKLKNMKLEPASREQMAPPSYAGGDRPLYPWGLQINLGTDEIERLGLKDALPTVGTSMKLEARVDVTSVSENESAGGKSCSVSLQITDLGLGAAKKDDDELADGLYKGGKK